MNVGFVVATDYPDMEEPLKRLRAGADTEHVTWMRKNDRVLKGLAQSAGVELPQFISKYEFDGEAYASEFLNAMDYVIVYATDKSSVTKFYVSKKTTYPYDIIFGKKIEVNVKKSRVTRKRAQRRAE